MKVSVCHYGSRRRYYIPEMLNRNNILECLYTDSYRYSILGCIAKLLSKIGVNSAELKRLLKRNPKIPKERIKSSDFWDIKIALASRFKGPFKTIETIFQGGSKTFRRQGISGDWLYAMFLENIEFTEFAKNNGLKIIVDIYENPFIFDELAVEYNLPEYQCIAADAIYTQAQARVRKLYLERMLRVADQYVIPSQYVADQLKRSSSFDSSKVNILPYPSSVKNTIYENKPIQGRIIWIGNDPVRKGLVYANRAIKSLQQQYPEVELRVIGPMPQPIVESPYFSHVKFLGYLNKDQLKKEFNAADMFLFPTLSEGFAGVLLEAAAFGVPIITTHASGFAPDAPAKFIPTHDSKAIEIAISQLLTDREYRQKLSIDTFNYSQSRTNTFESGILDIIFNRKH